MNERISDKKSPWQTCLILSAGVAFGCLLQWLIWDRPITLSFSTEGENPIVAASLFCGGKTMDVPSDRLDELLEQICAVEFTPTALEEAKAPGAMCRQATLIHQDGEQENVGFPICVYNGRVYKSSVDDGWFIMGFFPPNTWWEYSVPSPTFDFSTSDARPPVIRIWVRANETWYEVPKERIPDFLTRLDSIVFSPVESNTRPDGDDLAQITLRFQDSKEQYVTLPRTEGYICSEEDVYTLLEFFQED